MKRINVFAVGVCFLLSLQAYYAQLPPPPPPASTRYKSPEIYAYARQIAEIGKDQIWAGFEPFKYTTLKTDSGKSYIYFSPEPDNPKSQIFITLFDDYFIEHSLEENLVITFHEAFHIFEHDDPQRKGQKWGAENSLLVFEYQETSARNNALFTIESRLLYSALKSKNRSELKKKVRQFLAIRRLRQSELEARFAGFEKGAELNEGLAEYAGTKAVALGIEAAGRKQISMAFATLDSRAYLLKKYEMLDAISNVGRNVRRKFYYTGSAQAFLLDRLLTDWKTKVQMEGLSLQELLEKSVGPEKQSPQKIIDAVLKQYNYEKLLSDEEKTVAQRKAGNQALLDSTLNQKGRRYVIDFAALSQPGQVRNFDPMNVVMITPKLRVHTRSVKFAAGDLFTASFAQPVVEDLENRRYTTVVPENESQSVSVDGEVLDLSKPAEKRSSKSIVITSANFKLEAKAPGTIRVTNQEIVIKLSEKQ